MGGVDRHRDAELLTVSFQVGSGEDQCPQPLLFRDSPLATEIQSGRSGCEPVLPPQVVSEAHVVRPDPIIELPSAGADSSGGPGQLDRYSLWVRDILRCEARDQIDPSGEIYSVDIRQKEGHLQICLVVQERHSLLEEGKVDKIVALQVRPILAKPYQDVVDVHIAMLESAERIDRSRLSP